MQRHLIAAIIAIALLPAVAMSAQIPMDVQGTRYAAAFTYAGEHGAVGTVARPFDRITRAEAVKMIVALRPNLQAREQWFAGHMPPIALFPDIDQKAWYAPSVEAAFEAGIITGYPDQFFHPEAPVRAEEGMVMLQRAYGEDSPALNQGKAWYDHAVALSFSRNIVSPVEYLRLGIMLTRGQFLDMAYRQDVVTREKITAFVEPGMPPVATTVPSVVPVQRSFQQTVSFPSSVPVQPVRSVVTVQQQIPVASSSSSRSVSLPVAPQPVPPAPSTSASPSAKSFAITIPSLGITDLTITHPADPTTQKGLLAVLGNGVGHLFSYPGGAGKIMIYGHSSGYAWDVSKYTKIFRKINELKEGDQVYVTYRGKLHTYAVSYKQTVAANDLSAISGEGEELILYTCWPPDSIKQRYLVHAVPVSSVAAR